MINKVTFVLDRPLILYSPPTPDLNVVDIYGFKFIEGHIPAKVLVLQDFDEPLFTLGHCLHINLQNKSYDFDNCLFIQKFDNKTIMQFENYTDYYVNNFQN